MKPAKHTMTVLKQVVDSIPAYLVPKLARKHGVDKQSRSFSPWSHVVSQVHTQLAHSLSLNDVCDDLRTHSGALSTVRGATPPSRNGLSHANRNRNADMAEELFWATLADFLGHNEQAIRWQVWTALLTYVLLRFVAFRSRWTHSFSRLFTVLRAVLWNRLDMYSVLDFCGTASDPPPLRARPSQAYLPGFAP